jgi:hypothetical protein
VMTRNCKVVATCFVGREVRQYTRVAGDPPGPFIHAQDFPTPQSVLDLVALVVELEATVDPGVECDTILVNNDVGFAPGNRLIDSLEGSCTFAGRLRILHRENYGRSFGAYNHAFEALRGEYDHWIFTEDDILIHGERYFSRCLGALGASPRVGFVAIQGTSREVRLHAHGGVGLTHARVLDAVHRKYGRLPHSGRDEPQGYGDIIHRGEIAFTNAIHELGLDLVTVVSERPLYAYATEYMRATNWGRGRLKPA